MLWRSQVSEEHVALTCAFKIFGYYRFIFLKTSQTTRCFGFFCPPKCFPFILRSKIVNDFFFTFALKRDVWNSLVSAPPCNHDIPNQFTRSIIYWFLWDCSQNKLLFSIMMTGPVPKGVQPCMYSRKQEIHTHRENKRTTEMLLSLSKCISSYFSVLFQSTPISLLSKAKIGLDKCYKDWE